MLPLIFIASTVLADTLEQRDIVFYYGSRRRGRFAPFRSDRRSAEPDIATREGGVVEPGFVDICLHLIR